MLAAEESRHVALVLRRKPGEEILLFDGRDRAYRGVIEAVDPRRVEGRIVAERSAPEPRVRVGLYQCLPKGDKFDWVLEKATEIGVAEIVPVISERTVARPPASRAPAKVRRWEKIVRAAAQQCGRTDVPRLSTPVPFDRALVTFGRADRALIPWEAAEGLTLRRALREPPLPADRPVTVNVMIGPEGGFSPAEAARAVAAGARAVTLGPRILRTETAALVTAALILHELESSEGYDGKP